MLLSTDQLLYSQATIYAAMFSKNPINADTERAIESVHIKWAESGENEGLSFPQDKENCPEKCSLHIEWVSVNWGLTTITLSV